MLLPREKIRLKGVTSLSDIELLRAMIGSGNKGMNVGVIARRVARVLTQRGVDISYDDLLSIPGMGSAKTSELIAAFELGRRYLIASDKPIIDSPEKAVEQLADIRDKKQEHFVCLTLDGANRLIAKRIITIGTLTASLVHPREVFADAITDRAASIIVAHNHPSGNLQASEADIAVTKRLRDVGELLGVKLLDHIVITKLDFRVIE